MNVKRDKTSAVVINLFYTGLGIIRSLAERGIPVVGLTARRGVYGNYTRFGQVVTCPDSREDPDALCAFLMRLGRSERSCPVIFPTRDDDLMFLDRFRSELEPYYRLVMPGPGALKTCLNKWETHIAAERVGVAVPRAWNIGNEDDLTRAARQISYPCVLKPVSAHYWRQGDNWEKVGARKAIPIADERQLLTEYSKIAAADPRALLQEMIPGGDDCLVIQACYIDKEGRWVAGFNTQKLVQLPDGYGTGCVVQSVRRPELEAPTARLLESIGFSGIAEVEYKWDSAARQFKLIEINPRPWDQHRLGNACGVDLIHLAYCDHAGVELPALAPTIVGQKWIAEDAFVTNGLRLLWRGDPRLRSLLRQAKGKRLYAIWSALDPVPLFVYMVVEFLPGVIAAAWRAASSAIVGSLRASRRKKGPIYDTGVEKRKSLG